MKVHVSHVPISEVVWYVILVSTLYCLQYSDFIFDTLDSLVYMNVIFGDDITTATTSEQLDTKSSSMSSSAFFLSLFSCLVFLGFFFLTT